MCAEGITYETSHRKFVDGNIDFEEAKAWICCRHEGFSSKIGQSLYIRIICFSKFNNWNLIFILVGWQLHLRHHGILQRRRPISLHSKKETFVRTSSQAIFATTCQRISVSTESEYCSHGFETAEYLIVFPFKSSFKDRRYDCVSPFCGKSSIHCALSKRWPYPDSLTLRGSR